MAFDFSTIGTDGLIVSLTIAGGQTLQRVLVTKYVSSVAPAPGELHLADGRRIYWADTLVPLLVWEIDGQVI